MSAPKDWCQFYKTSTYKADDYSKWIRISNKRGEQIHLPYATLYRIAMAAREH